MTTRLTVLFLLIPGFATAQSYELFKLQNSYELEIANEEPTTLIVMFNRFLPGRSRKDSKFTTVEFRTVMPGRKHAIPFSGDQSVNIWIISGIDTTALSVLSWPDQRPRIFENGIDIEDPKDTELPKDYWGFSRYKEYLPTRPPK